MARYAFALAALLVAGCSGAAGSAAPGASSSCKSSYPSTQGFSEPCCPDWGVDACGAQLFCAALDGRTVATCYAQYSRFPGQSCTDGTQCASAGCNDGVCQGVPGGACTTQVGCGPGAGGSQNYSCANDGTGQLVCQSCPSSFDGNPTPGCSASSSSSGDTGSGSSSGSGSGSSSGDAGSSGTAPVAPPGCNLNLTSSCANGAFEYDCAEGVDPTAETSTLACSSLDSSGGANAYCCLEWPYGGSVCRPDDALACPSGSYGFACLGGDDPSSLSPSVVCSSATTDPDGVHVDYCCSD